MWERGDGRLEVAAADGRETAAPIVVRMLPIEPWTVVPLLKDGRRLPCVHGSLQWSWEGRTASARGSGNEDGVIAFYGVPAEVRRARLTVVHPWVGRMELPEEYERTPEPLPIALDRLPFARVHLRLPRPLQQRSGNLYVRSWPRWPLDGDLAPDRSEAVDTYPFAESGFIATDCIRNGDVHEVPFHLSRFARAQEIDGRSVPLEWVRAPFFLELEFRGEIVDRSDVLWIGPHDEVGPIVLKAGE